MGSFTKPSNKLLGLLLALFVLFAQAATAITITLEGSSLWLAAGIFGTLAFLFLAYLAFGFGRLGSLYCAKKGKNVHDIIASFRRDKFFRRLVFSALGSAMNFAMGIFETVLALIDKQLFPSLMAGLYFIALLARLYLLSIGDGADERKAAKGAILASSATILIGVSTLAIAFYVRFGEASFAHAKTLMYALALFSSIKIVSSSIAFFRSRQEKSVLELAYAELSFGLAFYSLFILQEEMLTVFGGDPTSAKTYAFSGYLFGGIVVLLGIGLLIEACRTDRNAKTKLPIPPQK